MQSEQCFIGFFLLLYLLLFSAFLVFTYPGVLLLFFLQILRWDVYYIVCCYSWYCPVTLSALFWQSMIGITLSALFWQSMIGITLSALFWQSKIGITPSAPFWQSMIGTDSDLKIWVIILGWLYEHWWQCGETWKFLLFNVTFLWCIFWWNKFLEGSFCNVLHDIVWKTKCMCDRF